MEHDKALNILQALADGTDPLTGKPFAAQSPYQQSDTVRALYHAIRVLENHPAPIRPVADKPAVEPSATARETKAKSSNATAKSSPQNAGRAWSEEEEARLATSFDGGKSVLDLATEHQRSRIAIEARLVKLGKLPAPSGTLRYPIKAGGGTASGVSERPRP